MSEPSRPFSWDEVAAELSARRADAPDVAAEQQWDDVAARLAAVLAEREVPAHDVTPHPPAVPPPPPPPAGQPMPEPVRGGPRLDLDLGDLDLGDLDGAADDDVDDVEESPFTARRSTRQPEAEQARPVDPAVLRGRLEAVLFVVDSPIDEPTLAAVLECDVPEVRTALADLAAEHDRRRGGVALRQVGSGWRLYTREEHADVVERHLLGGQRNRLTRAALETLAVIAYRQPVTRARVSAIRGVGVDGVMRTLVSRGLVRECGADPDTGGYLYATTELFLERLGLRSLDELPELGPLLPDPASLLDERARS